MVEKKKPLKKILIIAGIVIVAIIAIIVVASFLGGSDDMQGSSLDKKHINKVREFSPDGADGITYKQAYDHFYGDSTWKYFESDENKPIVEFSGDCTYDDKDGEAYLQFTLNDEGDIVGYYAQFKYEGEDKKEDLSDEECEALIFKPFISYAEEVRDDPLTDDQITQLYSAIEGSDSSDDYYDDSDYSDDSDDYSDDYYDDSDDSSFFDN